MPNLFDDDRDFEGFLSKIKDRASRNDSEGRNFKRLLDGMQWRGRGVSDNEDSIMADIVRAKGLVEGGGYLAPFSGIPYGVTLTAAGAGQVSTPSINSPQGQDTLLTGVQARINTAGIKVRLDTILLLSQSTNFNNLGAGYDLDMLDPTLTNNVVCLRSPIPFSSFQATVNFGAAGTCDLIFFLATRNFVQGGAMAGGGQVFSGGIRS